MPKVLVWEGPRQGNLFKNMKLTNTTIPLSAKDWRNAKKALSLWQDDWGETLVGNPNRDMGSIDECNKTEAKAGGWPSIQISLGRGFKFGRKNRGRVDSNQINEYQEIIENKWFAWKTRLGLFLELSPSMLYHGKHSYFELLSAEEGRAILEVFFDEMIKTSTIN